MCCLITTPREQFNLIDEKNFKIIFESQTVFSVPKEKNMP